MRRRFTSGLACGLTAVIVGAGPAARPAASAPIPGTPTARSAVPAGAGPYGLASAAARPPSRAQLTAALLKPSDLPRGFKVVKLDPGSLSGLDEACPALAAAPAGRVSAEAERLLANPGTTEVVAETLAQTSVKSARETFRQFSLIPRQCPSFSFQSSLLGIITVTITPLPLRRLGSGTTAMRIKAEGSPGQPVYLNSALVRYGGTLISLQNGSDGPVKQSTTQKYVSRAYAKVHARW
ncbi:hypothetical protein DQ384_12765 [Sphaerisporangium album]|uniref:Sensor domain-containing protein n=1 Tax=Sphaerisporangium album TaxID=509200 RepID=A0A367FLY1_9ACTN|nr:hypothetical protein [Sphaerisporangium album]RCG30842.1 hypothetical protein DQ384_12765 [Sphaerisporangium album]